MSKVCFRGLIGIFVGIMSGCSGQSAQAPDATSGIVSLTQVHWDGTSYVARTTQVTPAQAAELRDWRTRVDATRTAGGKIAEPRLPLLERDNSCNGNSLWLWDGINETGDMICFDNNGGPSTINLGAYACTNQTYCNTSTWAWSISSYWGGNYDVGVRTPQDNLCDTIVAWHQGPNSQDELDCLWYSQYLDIPIG